MKRSNVIVLAVIAAGAGAGLWRWLRPDPPTQVVVAKAERVPLLRSVVSATGEIKAKEFVDIQAEVAGVIVDLLVREGDEVEAGQVLTPLSNTLTKPITQMLLYTSQMGMLKSQPY